MSVRGDKSDLATDRLDFRICPRTDQTAAHRAQNQPLPAPGQTDYDALP
jgi:hypothetical protein